MRKIIFPDIYCVGEPYTLTICGVCLRLDQGVSVLLTQRVTLKNRVHKCISEFIINQGKNGIDFKYG